VAYFKALYLYIFYINGARHKNLGENSPCVECDSEGEPSERKARQVTSAPICSVMS